MASNENKRMGSRLKAKDKPEPWLATKKANATTSRQQILMTESAVAEKSVANTVVNNSSRRGRGRPKSKTKVADAANKKVRAKSMTTSTADVVLGQSKTPVPDVDDLRRKREEDAVACGRHVRSVIETPNLSCIPVSVTIVANDGDGKKEVAAAVAPKSSRICTGTGYEKEVEEDVAIEEEVDFREVRTYRHSGQQPILKGLQESGFISENERNSVGRGWQNVDVHNVLDPNGRVLEDQRTHQRQSPSASTRILDDSNRGRHVQKDDSFGATVYSNCRVFQRSRSRSPSKILPRSSRMEDYSSPRRSRSRSPRHWRESYQQRIVQQFPQFYEDTSNVDRFEYEDRTCRRDFNSDPGHSRRNDSCSPDNSRRHRTFPSPLYSERPPRRSETPSFASSSPRMLRDSVEGTRTTWMGLTSAKEEDIAGTSTAVDRKQRRHEQALRENDMANRQRHGRKPFYLTLDPEGKPYGPGQPAWVAEISKLATGLDPSCTHIRKQTFEDVQTFKDRLNENFEYSGTLNEDHLRGLMGKAVTKRRGELISLIKRNAEQPFNIDKPIWQRLEKLAYSKQREDKSEQGRYANSCRKTLGRTGARGVNGIREKLRAFLRRSPHPEEVEEEMQRDKGFGGQKRKKHILLQKKEENTAEVVLSDEENLSESLGKYSNSISNDTSNGSQSKRQARYVSNRIGRHNEYGVEDMEANSGKTPIGQRSYTVTNAKNLSKDEYIDSLKAEIQRLRERNAKASTSNPSKP